MCLILAFLVSVPAYVAASADESEQERVIIRTRGQSDVFALRQIGVTLIEEYEGFVLGWISQEAAELLANYGVDILDYPENRPIKLGNRVIDRSMSAASPYECGRLSDLYVLQTIGPTKSEWLEVLERGGAIVHAYVPHDAFLLSIPGAALPLVRSAPFVHWMGPYQSEWKVDASELPRTGELFVDALMVNTRPPLTLDTSPSIEVLRASRAGALDIVALRVRTEAVSDLMCNPLVLRLSPARPAPERADELAAEIVGGTFAGTGAQVNALGYNGTGVIVGHTDSGLDDGDLSTMHSDLAGRVLGLTDYGDGRNDWKVGWQGDNLAEDTYDSHGTAVAGIVAGNGALGVTDPNGFLLGWGVAPEAYLMTQRIFGDVGQPGQLRDIDKYDIVLGDVSYEDLVRELAIKDVAVSQNSWGVRVPDAPYVAQSPIYDGLTRDADPNQPGDQQMTFVFAAGNEGLAENGTLRIPATAKNVITVGGTENNRPEKGPCLTFGDANNPDEIWQGSSRDSQQTEGSSQIWLRQQSGLRPPGHRPPVMAIFNPWSVSW